MVLQVYNIAVETPLQKAAVLSEALGNTILLKREDLQAGRAAAASPLSCPASLRPCWRSC